MESASAAFVISAIVITPTAASIFWYRIGKRDGIKQERGRQVLKQRYSKPDNFKNVY